MHFCDFFDRDCHEDRLSWKAILVLLVAVVLLIRGLDVERKARQPTQYNHSIAESKAQGTFRSSGSYAPDFVRLGAERIDFNEVWVENGFRYEKTSLFTYKRTMVEDPVLNIATRGTNLIKVTMRNDVTFTFEGKAVSPRVASGRALLRFPISSKRAESLGGVSTLSIGNSRGDSISVGLTFGGRDDEDLRLPV